MASPSHRRCNVLNTLYVLTAVRLCDYPQARSACQCASSRGGLVPLEPYFHRRRFSAFGHRAPQPCGRSPVGRFGIGLCLRFCLLGGCSAMVHGSDADCRRDGSCVSSASVQHKRLLMETRAGTGTCGSPIRCNFFAYDFVFIIGPLCVCLRHCPVPMDGGWYHDGRGGCDQPALQQTHRFRQVRICLYPCYPFYLLCV